MEQLLHGLNQPLTGLQCSLEVALAAPRTVDYYTQRMHEGLELTGRMRTLVNAIRELVDGEREIKNDAIEDRVDLQKILREVMNDLEPVAEVKRVHLMLGGNATGAWVKGGRPKLSALVFRMLESALSEAVQGSALRIEIGEAGGEATDFVWFRMAWQTAVRWSELSPPELGLLVAQATWEQVGAQWARERTETAETVTVRLPGVAGEGNS
jgi:signal transduction histidine kinase